MARPDHNAAASHTFHPRAFTARSEGLLDDPFATHRHKIVYVLALISVLALLPFFINNHMQGRYGLDICLAVFCAVLLIDAWAIYRGRAMPIPLWTLTLPVVAGFTLAMWYQLYIGLVWAYPVVLLFFFILPRRIALLVTSGVVALIGALVLSEIELRLAGRFVVSLALIVILTNAFVGVIEDLHRKVIEQALTDPLTGAYNRWHMDPALAAARARMQRGASAPSLLMIDLDHFKKVNDVHGHAAGDEVLRLVAAAVAKRMREPDSLFRVGGEEFVLLLPDTDLGGAAVLAEDLRSLIARTPSATGVSVTASLGISTLLPGEGVERWLQRADEAMYRAKQGGRNQVVIGHSDIA